MPNATQPVCEPASPEQRERPAPIRLLAVLAVAFLLGAGFFALWLQIRHEDANAREARSRELIAAVNYAELCLTRMEAATRHFVLSGDEAQIAYRDDMERRLRAELNNLTMLSAANEAQLAHLAELRRLIERKRENLAQPVALRRAGRVEEAGGLIQLAATRDTTEAVRDQVNRIEAEERRLLAQSGAQARSVSDLITSLIVAGNLAAMAFALAALGLSHRASRARTQAEQRLQAVNRLQQAVLDGTVHSVISTDPAGVITLFSRGAEKMLGYPAAEMVGRCTPERLHLPSEVAARAAELSAQLGRPLSPGFEVFVARARLGSTDEREWTYVRRDGTRLPVLLSITALRDAAGGISGFLGIAQDLTEQKKAEITVQASEERLGQVLGHAECLVWEARVTLRGDDWDWRMSVYPSGLYRRLSADYSPGGGTGLWYKFEIPEQAEMNRRAREAMDRRLAGYVQEFRVQRDGRTTWLRETVSVRPQAEGHFWLVGVVMDITDRKMLESALRASEERLGSALEGSNSGVWDWNAETNEVYFSRQWKAMLGYEEEEVGTTLAEWETRVHPEDLPKAYEALQRHFSGETPHYEHEHRLRHKDGRWLWILDRGRVVEWAALGKPRRVIGTHTDISARKLAEEALAKSEAQFRSAFDYAGIGMALVGLDGRWLQVNRQVPAMLGYTEAELLTRTFQDITHPDDLESDLANVQALLAGRSHHYQMEKRYLHRDGRAVYARLTVTLVRDHRGQPIHFISQIEDITARHRTEQALVASQRQLNDVFRSMAEGLVVHDTDGRIVECNAAAESILGLTRAQLMGLTEMDPRWQALHEDGSPCLPERMPSTITRLTGQPQRGVILGVRKGDGALRWLSVNTEAILDEGGALRSVVASFADMTERKQLLDSLALARDQALEASRLKSTFLANMSHEIRTPMNGVLGMADLLMESPLNEEQRQMSRVIQNSARSLLTIIDDILDLSKIEAGKIAIEDRDFDLGEQVDQALALLSPRAQARGLRLESDLPATALPLVRGDAARLQQVLVNLLGNAIKFTERGSVTLGVHLRPAAAPGRCAFRVEVRDSGIGISPAQQARLFQPFSQADESTTRKYGGTGLGLAISKQLVELMGGRIGLESKVGRGSVFWFELELPVAGAPAPKPAATRARPAPAPHRPRVLVAEDNEANQLVIRLMLDKLELDYDIVGDGPSALRQLEQGGYAAVLMDCQMPGLDGYETTRRIRDGAAGAAQARVPVFALTAHAMASDREKCLEAGMNDYLAKPVRLELLQQTLGRYGIPTAPLVAAVAPAPAAEPVLDEEHLRELRELPGERDGETLLDALVRRALVDLPAGLGRLHGLADQHAGPETAQLAHRLAGSAASLGAVGLRGCLLACEQSARQGDWAAIAVQRSTLDRQWELLQDALRSVSRPARP